MADGDLIPPAVIDILGDDSGFRATLAKDTSLLAAWANTDTTTKLGADSGSFQRTYAEVQGELLGFARELTRARLGANATPFWTEIAALRAEMGAMSPLDINVDANIGMALAKIALLKGDLASAQVSALTTAALASAAGGAGGGGGGGAGAAGLLGLLGGRGGGGGGGGLGALLGMQGGGIGLGWLGGLLAALPSGALASLLGIGPERILGSTLGVAGSIAGAGLGAGLLGLGAAGVGAVGMGTDLAGIGQAAGDIRNTVSAMNALSQAIAVYGAGSTQAVTAQSQLNFTLSSFNPVARSAVTAAAMMAIGFKTQFDAVTGYAEKTGAQIIGQFIGVAAKFLPTIGRFATENMAIIQKALQPLATWLTGPGLRIFTNLEQIFQRNLPAAMSLFVNGVELVIKIMDIAAQYTGRFIQDAAKWAQKLNTTDFSKVAGTVKNLIGLFFTWLGLAVSIGKVIYEVFKPAVGFGKEFAKQFTDAFNQISNWLKTSGMQKTLHNLFSAHKEQFDILMRAVKDVLPVLEHFMQDWLKIENVVVRVMNAVLGPLVRIIGDLLKIPMVATILGWAGAIFFAGRALLGLATLLLGNPFGLALVAIALVAVGIYELATHWHQVWTDIKNWTADAVSFIRAHMILVGATLSLLLGPMGLLITAALEVYLHWKQIWGAIGPIVKRAAAEVSGAVGVIMGVVKAAWDLIAAYTKASWDLFVSVIKVAVDLVVGVVKVASDVLMGNWSGAWNAMKTTVIQVWNAIKSGVMQAVNAVVSGVEAAWNGLKGAVALTWAALVSVFDSVKKTVLGAFRGAGSWLTDIGKSIVQGLINGVDSLLGKAGAEVSKLAHLFTSIPSKILGIFSPSTVFYGYGQNIVQGLVLGVQSKESIAAAAIGHLAGAVRGVPFGLSGTSGGLGATGYGVNYAPQWHVTINAPGGNVPAIEDGVRKLVQQEQALTIQRLRAGSISSA